MSGNGKKWTERAKDSVIRFMYGRYGADELYKALIILTFVLIVANLFARTFILSLLEVAVFVYALFRFFSRNLEARRKENAWYTARLASVKKSFRIAKAAWRDRKTKVYRACPSCKEVLQIPKTMRGREVRCPKCGFVFRLK